SGCGTWTRGMRMAASPGRTRILRKPAGGFHCAPPPGGLAPAPPGCARLRPGAPAREGAMRIWLAAIAMLCAAAVHAEPLNYDYAYLKSGESHVNGRSFRNDTLGAY